MESPSFVESIDYIEFWCGNAKLLANYWCITLGYTPFVERGLKTGDRSQSSFVVTQGNTTFMFTSSTTRQNPDFYQHLSVHGDSVRNICFRVSNVDYSFRRAVSGGAIPLESPHNVEDSQGFLRVAQIKSHFGDVVHTLVDRTRYRGSFFPGFVSSFPTKSKRCDIVAIDHVAIAFPRGQIKDALDWYRDCLGFVQFLCNDEENEEGLTILGMDDAEGGLKTLVAACNDAPLSFKLVLVEAVDGSKQNQVQEFLEFHGGSGVQHIALRSEDIFCTVERLQDHGLNFLNVPSTYYDTVFQSPDAFMIEQRERMERLGLLMDIAETKRTLRDSTPKFIMQCFTLPLFDRPTFFLEMISRNGSSGFGKKTIKTLFEAVENQRRQRETRQ